MKVKWGKELFEGVEVNMDEEPMVFKAQLFALTGVEPHRQKVLCKGASLKDDSWDSVKPKVKPGTTFLLMGSKEEDIPTQAVEKTQFIEDMDESELHSALKLPAGLTNLGNTCYMNATIQCLKTVPEFCQSLLEFKGSIGVMGGPDHDALSITAAMRDLYRLVQALFIGSRVRSLKSQFFILIRLALSKVNFILLIFLSGQWIAELVFLHLSCFR